MTIICFTDSPTLKSLDFLHTNLLSMQDRHLSYEVWSVITLSTELEKRGELDLEGSAPWSLKDVLHDDSVCADYHTQQILRACQGSVDKVYTSVNSWTAGTVHPDPWLRMPAWKDCSTVLIDLLRLCICRSVSAELTRHDRSCQHNFTRPLDSLDMYA